MSKFAVDYANLENVIYKKAYKLSEVQERLEKVGWDIVRFKDNDDKAKLWQIQSADDGEYIVALYQDEDLEKKASKNPWEVIMIKTAGELQISYRGDPLVRLASHKLGIAKSELDQVVQYLPKKLAENKKLVNALLTELSASTKQEVLQKYPELKV